MPSVPPPGPAMPVIASATSAPETRRAPSAMRPRALGAHGAVAAEDVLVDAEDRLLRGVRVGDGVEQEVVARARLLRDHVTDEAAGARLGDRERPAARAERAADDAGERVLALAVDDVAEARADLLRGALRELAHDRLRIGGAGAPGLRDAGPGARASTFTSISGKCAR